jgi:hypothetical protein
MSEDTFLSQPGSTGVYIYFAFIILLMIIYTIIITSIYGMDGINDHDILNEVYAYDVPIIGNFGGWSLSHLIAFYIAGLLFPQQWVLIFILGVAWEFFEIVIGISLEGLLGKSKYTGNRRSLYGTKWVTGTLTDIWVNSVGLFLGYWTAMFLEERSNENNKWEMPWTSS